MEELHQVVVNELKSLVKTLNLSVIESQNERHKQDSKPNFPSESESIRIRDHFPASNPMDQRTEDQEQLGDIDEDVSAHMPSSDRITLDLVLRACPQIVDYAPAGAVRNWRDLVTAASVVRNMLEVSTTAYTKACTTMGIKTTAIVMACILERATSINSPGGYLRDLTRRCERRQFVPNHMLMAVLRAHATSGIGGNEMERPVRFHYEGPFQEKQGVIIPPEYRSAD
jgi:replication initiation protein RepC